MIRGSAKNLIQPGDDSPYAMWYKPPKLDGFGRGVFQAHGGFSVKDLKDEIPFTVIPHKAEGMAMMTAFFFETLADKHPDILTTYLSILDQRGHQTTVAELLKKGETSDAILMRIAHTPDSLLSDTLDKEEKVVAYRRMLMSGSVRCAVGDVESIFRQMLPLGSSVFKKIFEAAGMGKEYDGMATYPQVVQGLDRIRNSFGAREELDHQLQMNANLKQVLLANGLGDIPNPGFVLPKIAYNTTTKFEATGDRDISEAVAMQFSGLSEDGYHRWKGDIFPRIATLQVELMRKRGDLNGDGKCEVVTYFGQPWVTDWACNPDENRPMIIYEQNGIKWALPTSKELQRGMFKAEGVDSAIAEAKRQAKEAGYEKAWKNYFKQVCQSRKINIREIAERTVTLTSCVIREIANRTLGQRVFDVPALDTYVKDILPYSSKI